MGFGSWSSTAYTTYSCNRGFNTTTALDGTVTLTSNYTAQDIFRSHKLDEALNPYKVVRQCCDSDEHPNTIPVILALDVTGSMGAAAAEVAKKLNEVMTKLYKQIKDVEFCVMGIGDLAYDSAPIQASQFESDIRIAEQLDKVYFEAGGGGNSFESYTAAWYFGLRHTDLDCWKRGKKGIIITMGDEPLNPYLPKGSLGPYIGDTLEADVETNKLYKEAIKKFDIYHLAVKDGKTSFDYYKDAIMESFKKYLDEEHFKVVNLNNIAGTIVDIISGAQNDAPTVFTESGIVW